MVVTQPPQLEPIQGVQLFAQQGGIGLREAQGPEAAVLGERRVHVAEAVAGEGLGDLAMALHAREAAHRKEHEAVLRNAVPLPEAGIGPGAELHFARAVRQDGEARGREHLEDWIPAEDLAVFNAALIGEIEVIAEYPEKCQQLVPAAEYAIKELGGTGQEGANADALKVGQEIKAFADMSAISQPYLDALVRQKVITVGGMKRAKSSTQTWSGASRTLAGSLTTKVSARIRSSRCVAVI